MSRPTLEQERELLRLRCRLARLRVQAARQRAAPPPALHAAWRVAGGLYALRRSLLWRLAAAPRSRRVWARVLWRLFSGSLKIGK